MRQSLPYIPIYIAALDADTANLTDAAFGAYVRILMSMWASGGWIPGDDASLCRIARSDPRNWRRRIAPVVRPLLQQAADGRVSQKRLLRELQRAAAKSAARSAAAHRRWRPDLFLDPTTRQ
jgi:uncharacterized protein YdaU (DUF1376 family)